MISCNNFIQITTRKFVAKFKDSFQFFEEEEISRIRKIVGIYWHDADCGEEGGGRRGEEERVHVNYERENGGQRRCLRGCGEQLRFNGRREGFAFANRDLA